MAVHTAAYTLRVPLYFAYGSNMSRARLEARVGVVRDLGAIHLPGHVHRFSKRGRDGTGKGNVEARAAQDLVWGVLYDLGAAQFEALRAFESGYREARLGMDAAHLGRVEALSFVACEAVAELAPTTAYLEHYRQGVVEHGIPATYLQEIFDSLVAQFGAQFGDQFPRSHD
ncbi:gamma-glutamylcyclotransferase [Pseudenhygromyxa sp. WMMC2535]|uniref:gamma-glutamylcyclotransferase family protein n=1 Tax=Pseudenhygromyxa sp. WMMC2535 TaxID=2712867 RepID=UPI001595C603|nr:gamma-glutamylcyclotransferase family protein [Pseudenhygromyxa sp. WMMC2535]NVB39189.1 gamma-glutamylcyclotransferase [Pseudenhygromyxa sp. WMMC2535]